MIRNFVDIDPKLDKINDECGVFGIYKNDEDIDIVAVTHDDIPRTKVLTVHQISL